MTQVYARFGRIYPMLLAGMFTLALSACGQGSIEEPWTQNDPQWKQAHFASQVPDEALKERAALTQVDR